MDINEILIHLGEDRSKYFNAVSPPIIQSSNFAFDSVEDLRTAIADELNAHIYTRGNNPTVQILRKKIAALEKAEDALITGSGASAIAISVLANVKAGDHVIVINHPYSWANKLFTEILTKYNVSHTFVDGRDIENIRAAIQPNTTLLYLESPNSITFELQDLEACAKLARAHNIITVIDNSYASPIFQNPISLGIDIAIHSGTKYINGHSDVVCGMVCGSKKMIEKIFKYEYMTYGTIISPNDAALVLRGLRSLDIRMRHIQKTASAVISAIEGHPLIDQIIYPHHHSFPQLELAKKQTSGSTGLFSIVLKADRKEDVMTFVKNLKRFIIAVSWGGHESLCMPFIAFHDMEESPDHFVSWKLIRFSIGFEEANYLIEDLQNALNSISNKT